VVVVSLLAELIRVIYTDNQKHPVTAFLQNCSITVIRGEDAEIVLNRNLTIDINQYPDNARIESLLCDSTGRISDRFIHANIDEQIILIHNAKMGDQTRQRLLAGVSWDESVDILNADSVLSHITITGNDSSILLRKLGVNPEELKTGEWLNFNDALIATNESSSEIPVFDILLRSESKEDLLEQMVEHGCVIGNESQWDTFRIQNGIIGTGEFTGSYIPYDLGLHHLVDLTKGCYPGQEIHARMESRNARSRRLIRIQSEQALTTGDYRNTDIGRITLTSVGHLDSMSYAFALMSNKHELPDNFHLIREGVSINVFIFQDPADQ